LAERRKLLASFAATAAALGMRQQARAQASADLPLTVEYESAGTPIPADFIGLSYESALLASSDYFTPRNPSVFGLLRALGADGVLRIGGNTSERTVWSGAGSSSPTDGFAITPAAIDALAALLRALGWRLIYGLNLARGTPEAAADEAAYVANAVGRQLLAFQISNEPDGFGRWSAVRPSSYDVSDFLAEWQRFRSAIHTRLPDAPFAGPAVAGETGWIPPFAETARGSLVLLTRHYYSDGPARAPHISLPKLLSSAGQLDPILSDLQKISRTYHLPFRIAETNSIFAEGHPGVSDTFGASLWGLELMFQVAQAGGAGINFHTGDAKAYTPIGPGRDGRHVARPLFYGMLMFREACAEAAEIVPTRGGPSSAGPPPSGTSDVNLAAYAVRSRNGALRVCLINKDLFQSAQVRINVGRRFSAASILRLAAGWVDATTGVTLGGAAVDDFGNWAPTALEAIRPETMITVEVPVTSAALLLCGN
jgi:hypothetical protein